MEKLEYNHDRLSAHFAYSEDSATGLVSKKTNCQIGSFDKHENLPKAIRVKLDGKRYLVHRVIWVLVYGNISPNLDIDHIDGNPWNNKISNLRLVEKKINQRNRKKMKNNKTGVCGVSYHKTGNNSGGYNEYVRPTWISETGKQLHKDFNVNKFPTFEMAVEFAELYRSMKIEDVESYTERHGK